MQSNNEEKQEEERRSQFLMEANRQFALLRADAAVWQEELEERATWEGTLLDDLEEENSQALAPSHKDTM